MSMVFPSSREQKCPRDDCGSRQVERLGPEAEFAGLGLDSSACALWLCIMCQRPFKLVSEPHIAAATVRRRRGQGLPLQQREDLLPMTHRRMP